MDKKFKKDILKVIRDEDQACELGIIESALVNEYSYEKIMDGPFNKLASRIKNYLRILSDDGMVIISEGRSGGWSHITSFYTLSAKGYLEFDPWYKKLWRFFNDDFAKLLSVISVILSIVATIVSFSK